jgi:hypothetical protein
MSSDYLRWTLYFANMLLNVSGQILISVGCIFLLVYQRDYFFVPTLLTSVSLFFILIGITIFCLSIVGLVWVYKKNFILEGSYIVSLVAIAGALLILGIVVLTLSLNGKIPNKLYDELAESVALFDEFSPESPHTIKMNSIQSNFKCCGLDSYNDWEDSKNLNKQIVRDQYLNNEFLLNKNQIWFNVPDTCCKRQKQNCGKDFSTNSTLYTQGCFGILKHFVINFSYTSFAVCMGVMLIILFCIVYFLYVGLCFEGEYYLLNAY